MQGDKWDAMPQIQCRATDFKFSTSRSLSLSFSRSLSPQKHQLLERRELGSNKKNKTCALKRESSLKNQSGGICYRVVLFSDEEVELHRLQIHQSFGNQEI
ncbi:hypothetical protein HPP92_003870 [Vanilla planifolia]|uniref:Uncharacterized protein n=1 Tax=Vanilla planifolia TaxID=51239 RepID=A0A835VK82_VANPL|nr:hypothetical protein HPP92_004322 [Vanilla planifolia]KAG0503798.1 hypothetical protein HPP92_003870 [Vanilla planifolia]